MALLVCTNGTARVLTRDNIHKQVAWKVEMWPYDRMLDKVVSSNGKTYRYNIYVDEEGLLKQLPVNHLASIMAHPLCYSYGFIISGEAIIEPYEQGVHYTLDDFEAIKGGVVADGDDDDGETLADRNATGKSATVRVGRGGKIR